MGMENYDGLTLDMWKRFVPVLMFFMATLPACRRPIDIPTEFPTPTGPAASTPVSKGAYNRDAELEKKFADIAREARGRVGVAGVVIETGEAAFLKADEHYPMQSVYKLPIAMAVMEQVKLGKLDLDEKVGVTRENMVRAGQASPLRDKNPDGGEFTIRELIRLALVESDGTASDVLLRILGGPAEVQSYLTQIGVIDMKVVNTEKEIGRDWQTQYNNWATPKAAVALLSGVRKWPSPGDDFQELIVHRFMIDSVPGPKRLKGLLPKDTVVAHKTGTGGSKNGIYAATNDIGIIYLPNGKHLGIAVFVSDSSANEPTREAVIAKIAKAAWNRWGSGNAGLDHRQFDFNVRDIRIGDSPERVHRILGEPKSKSWKTVDECGLTKQWRWRYSGLEIVLEHDPNNVLYVDAVEVTSSKWKIGPGLTIGQEKKDLVSILGSGAEEQEQGYDGILWYSTIQEDLGELFFRNKKLVKFRMFVNPC
jgi:beta-lactamase class A